MAVTSRVAIIAVVAIAVGSGVGASRTGRPLVDVRIDGSGWKGLMDCRCGSQRHTRLIIVRQVLVRKRSAGFSRRHVVDMLRLLLWWLWLWKLL
jgi:hypothetical protein